MCANNESSDSGDDRRKVNNADPNEESVRALLVSPSKKDQQRGLLFVRKLEPDVALQLLLLCISSSKFEFCRANAATLIGELRLESSTQCVQELVSLLHSDEDYGVRGAAAAGLGYHAENHPSTRGEIVDALTRAIFEDTDWQVKFSALAALGEARDVRAVPVLLPNLSSDNALFVQATVGALGNIGDVKTVPHLLTLLGDKDMMTRQRLAQALGDIKECLSEPAVLDALRTLARDTSMAVRDAAKYSLERAGCSGDPARKSDLSDDELMEREVTLMFSGDETGNADVNAGDALRRRLERSFDKEWVHEKASSQPPVPSVPVVSPNAQQILAEHEFSTAVGNLRSSDIRKQTLALITLRRGNADRVRSAVLDAGLLDHSRTAMRVRSLAIRLIARARDVHTVILTLKNDPEENVRSACCDAAAEAGGGSMARQACIESFESDSHWLVRISAAIALGTIGKGCIETENALIRSLEKDGVKDLTEPQASVVRRHAVTALGFLGSVAALPIFTRLTIEPNTDEAVRLRIANALRGIRCKESVEVLKRLVTDEIEEVAEMAQGSLDTLTQQGFA